MEYELHRRSGKLGEMRLRWGVVRKINCCEGLRLMGHLRRDNGRHLLLRFMEHRRGDANL